MKVAIFTAIITTIGVAWGIYVHVAGQHAPISAQLVGEDSKSPVEQVEIIGPDGTSVTSNKMGIVTFPLSWCGKDVRIYQGKRSTFLGRFVLPRNANSLIEIPLPENKQGEK